MKRFEPSTLRWFELKRESICSYGFWSSLTTEAVLTDAGQWDRLWFLGDLVGYGPNPNECVERLRELGAAPALSGNHDWAVLRKLDTEEFNDDARRAVRWTRQQMNDNNRLPRQLAAARGRPRSAASPRRGQNTSVCGDCSTRPPACGPLRFSALFAR
jgi:predicted MPP superfamily phosphohydrolase